MELSITAKTKRSNSLNTIQEQRVQSATATDKPRERGQVTVPPARHKIRKFRKSKPFCVRATPHVLLLVTRSVTTTRRHYYIILFILTLRHTRRK